MFPESTNLNGIDLGYRPFSYFWPIGLKTHLLAKVKGAERKILLRRLIATKQLDDIPETLTRSALSDDERRARSYVHPAMMGGEFLPDMDEQEVEIARITLQSVTQDVTSVYARREGGRIYYRVVDEYEGDTLSDQRERISDQPLTLGELEAYFNAASDVFEALAMNFDVDSDLDHILIFAEATSPFYPQFGDLYARRIASWGEQLRSESPRVNSGGNQ
jgi:hypothetical protein